MYFHTLAQYLTHFAGRTAAPVTAAHPYTVATSDAWSMLRRGLGVSEGVVEGDRVRLTPTGMAGINGVVDYASRDFFGVRSDDGLYRFFAGRGNVAMVLHHLFGAIDEGQAHYAWRTWLSAALA